MERHLYQKKLHRKKDNAIIEAALHVFTRYGYDKTSMDRIAFIAGVSLATVYKHYPTKKVLFLAAIEQGWNQVVEKYTFPNMDHLDMSQAFEHVALRYVNTVHEKNTKKLIALCLSPHLPQRMGETFYTHLVEPTRLFLQNMLRQQQESLHVQMHVRFFLGAINDILIWPTFVLGLESIPEKSVKTVISCALSVLQQQLAKK